MQSVFACSPCKLNIRPSQEISTFWPEIKGLLFSRIAKTHTWIRQSTSASIIGLKGQPLYPSRPALHSNSHQAINSAAISAGFCGAKLLSGSFQIHITLLSVNLFLRPTPRLPHGVMTEETSVICLLETQLMRKNDCLVPSQFTHEKWARAELVCTGVDWSLQGELYESFWLYGFWKLVMKFGSCGMTEWDFWLIFTSKLIYSRWNTASQN